MFNYEKKEFKDVAKTFADEIFGDDFFSFEKKNSEYYKKNIDGKLKLAIPMPGVEKENVKIYFENGMLVVEANSKPWYVNLEYKNKFQLIDCDENSIEAEYKNGVLELTIDKKISKKTVNIK